MAQNFQLSCSQTFVSLEAFDNTLARLNRIFRALLLVNADVCELSSLDVIFFSEDVRWTLDHLRKFIFLIGLAIVVRSSTVCLRIVSSAWTENDLIVTAPVFVLLSLVSMLWTFRWGNEPTLTCRHISIWNNICWQQTTYRRRCRVSHLDVDDPWRRYILLLLLFNAYLWLFLSVVLFRLGYNAVAHNFFLY